MGVVSESEGLVIFVTAEGESIARNTSERHKVV